MEYYSVYSCISPVWNYNNQEVLIYKMALMRFVDVLKKLLYVSTLIIRKCFWTIQCTCLEIMYHRTNHLIKLILVSLGLHIHCTCCTHICSCHGAKIYSWPCILSILRLIFFFLFLVLQLGENLVGTISNIMDADTSLLQEAQRRSKSCSRFVFLNSFKPCR